MQKTKKYFLPGVVVGKELYDWLKAKAGRESRSMSRQLVVELAEAQKREGK